MKNLEKIENLILESENLPTLPGIALEIIEAYQKPDPDIQQIGDLLTTDPPLTGKILKTVNSAFFNLPTKIRLYSEFPTAEYAKYQAGYAFYPDFK